MGDDVLHTMLHVHCGELRSRDRWELPDDVSKLAIRSASVEAGCRSCIVPDGYILVRFGVNDAASVHVNEEMVAAKENRHPALGD